MLSSTLQPNEISEINNGDFFFSLLSQKSTDNHIYERQSPAVAFLKINN